MIPNLKNIILQEPSNPIILNSRAGLKNWRNKLATLKAGGTGILNIACAGDSITEGFINAANLASLQANSFKWKLTTLFNSRYDDVGWGYLPEHYPSAGAGPTPLTYTGTWSTTNYGFVRRAKVNNVSGDYLEFSFNGTGCDIFTRQNTSQTGSLLVSIDGGDAVEHNLRTTPTTFPKKLTIATELTNTTHTVKITNNAAQTFAFMGWMETKGSRGVRVNLMGKSGGVAGNFSDTTTSKTCWDGIIGTGITPDLVIYNIGVNDHLINIVPATFQSEMQEDITMLKALGADIIVGTDGCDDQTGYTYTAQNYLDIIRSIALQNNCCYIDFNRRWGGVGSARTNGYLPVASPTDPHPTIKGHNDIYEVLLKLIDP